MEVSGQLQVVGGLLQEITPVHKEKWAVWAPESLRMVFRLENGPLLNHRKELFKFALYVLLLSACCRLNPYNLKISHSGADCTGFSGRQLH